MSLKATVAAAVDQAFEAVGDIPVTVTVRMGKPTTGTYDPVTDSTPVTWPIEADVQAIGYDEAEEQGAGNSLGGLAEPESRMRNFVIKGKDLQGIEAEQEGEVVDNGLVWKVYKVEPDPTYSVWIIYTRNPQPV